MMRECLSCHAPLGPGDLSRKASKDIEAERKAQGVQGILFRCYICSYCGHENLFVDFHAMEGESQEDFARRRDELETTIRLSPQSEVGVALTEKRPVSP